MNNKIKKVWDFIFKIDPNFQKIPLKISRKNVNIDTELQSFYLNHFLSALYEKSPHNIIDVIRPYTQKDGKNASD